MYPQKVMFQKIKDFLSSVDTKSISEERRAKLQPLIDFIQEKSDNKEPILLNFICTHNSRRSHLAQIWAQTLSAYHDIQKVSTYSAGTEATAVFPKVLETLERTGFKTAQLSEGQNIVYAMKFDEKAHPIIGFSKALDHKFNPRSGFAAIMTCDSANEACPVVTGAKKRIPITYDDPKISDGKPEQDATYAERSKQIATEMVYVFGVVSR